MTSIRFILNGRAQSESRVPPSTTVLDYLRGVARLTGTKEGCAEGDCGACTIAIADAHSPSWRAVNSCLMALPQLDGCAVMTVEGLADAEGGLHPAQQALAEADGTQCGFCTPGFVMSMFAFAQSAGSANDDAIHEALAGNLCRCTGYRPIVEVCRTLAGQGGVAVPALPSPGDGRAGGGDQVFHLPRTLAELTGLRAAHPQALVLGGGTDLGLLLSKERKTFAVAILTARVAEMKTVRADAAGIELGGAVTYSEALPLLDRHFPPFAALVRRIGSRQIRNLGTIAGNLATASPIGDSAPCLIALGADVTLASSSASRTLPVADFLAGYRKTAMRPDEVIASIRIPFLPQDERFAVYKLSKRFDQDISTVIGAFRLKAQDGTVRDLRAVYGGMAATTARASNVETALAGKPWTAESLAGADALIARDFTPMTDQRGSAAYRLRAAANLLRRFQIETSGAGVLSRVEAL